MRRCARPVVFIRESTRISTNFLCSYSRDSRDSRIALPCTFASNLLRFDPEIRSAPQDDTRIGEIEHAQVEFEKHLGIEPPGVLQ